MAAASHVPCPCSLRCPADPHPRLAGTLCTTWSWPEGTCGTGDWQLFICPDTIPGHGRGAEFGQGKLSKVLFQLRGMRKYTTFFFFFSFFSSVKHPPKVNSMAINLIPCSGWLGKRLLVAALTLTERHSPVLAFSYSKSLKTQSS